MVLGVWLVLSVEPVQLWLNIHLLTQPHPQVQLWYTTGYFFKLNNTLDHSGDISGKLEVPTMCKVCVR